MLDVVAAVIVKDGRILIAQRAEKGSLYGKWEFPGGKIEKGETPEESLCREIKEELSLEIKVGTRIGENIFEAEQGIIRLQAYFAELNQGRPLLNVHAAYKWVKVEELTLYDFAPADIPFIYMLEAYHRKEKF